MGKPPHTSLIGEKHIVQLISEIFITPGDIARSVEEFQEMGFACPVGADEDVDTRR
jgi:hypothetical protein